MAAVGGAGVKRGADVAPEDVHDAKRPCVAERAPLERCLQHWGIVGGLSELLDPESVGSLKMATPAAGDDDKPGTVPLRSWWHGRDAHAIIKRYVKEGYKVVRCHGLGVSYRRVRCIRIVGVNMLPLQLITLRVGSEKLLMGGPMHWTIWATSEMWGDGDRIMGLPARHN